MFRSSTKALIVALAVMPWLAAPAAAQGGPATELGGGYVLSVDTSGHDGSARSGGSLRHNWQVDLAIPARKVSVVAALAGGTSGADGLRSSDLFVLGGVRVHLSSRSPRVAPFVQVLGGLFRQDSDTRRSPETLGVVQPGAGVNVMASRRVGVRAGLDYAFVPVGSEVGGAVWSALRFVMGGTVRLGRT